MSSKGLNNNSSDRNRSKSSSLQTEERPMVQVDRAQWFIDSGMVLVTDPVADKYLKQVPKSKDGVQVQSRQESKQTV